MNDDGHLHSHAQNRYAVIPTPIRLRSSQELSGNAITIAFLDSGFFPHPDLTQPDNRILAYHDVTNPDSRLSAERKPQGWKWHGTQTSVVAAGNGYLSEGVYRGLACRSNVVLVKVSDEGKISETNIARGLEWVLENHKRLDIRILSISLGGDADVPYQQNEVDQLAEQCVKEGIAVVVAAGNSGCTDRHKTVPPANAPSVITVGGYSDRNRMDTAEFELYCSSFGKTADGILKPEIIAPAIWIAAPILPDTPEYQRAEKLTHILSSADYELPSLYKALQVSAGLPSDLSSADEIRSAAESMLKNGKVVSTHYQHVDGTSFAAPITASVIAQMLEANPSLTPRMIKQILISTAERIQGAPLIRQGYGVLNARTAMEQARQECHPISDEEFLPPRIAGDKIIFYYHNHHVSSVSLAGDFNEWDPESTPFVREENGTWRAEIKLSEPGEYKYKFVLDGGFWIEDPSNGLKTKDNYGGLNSVIVLAASKATFTGPAEGIPS